ncbi:uncharacterized protein LOC131026814 isoform X1 [Cryptomeria japonica]|uniref:uncharacterized protein LOC131026814 isoform X1 n=1 Tax=Cryptomeria japonica TaxID=3369 RepID=UPI0027DA896E|nr:uncharacterized protein LOC131026814 isoform X1 [Cryptomeria japonica]
MWGRIAGGGFRGCISSPSNNFKLFIKFNLFSTASMSMHAEAEDLHSAKRSKLNNNDNTKKVGTHNGSFHCDEALACYMIRLTNKFRDAHIVRTRDSKVLDTLDAVLDVGGVYDPEKDCYDHHQKGFDHDFGHGFKTKLSSAGLVYKHYGREIVAKELGLNPDHSDVESVYIALYKGFMEEIDAVDNGINQYDTEKPARYIRNTHLSARISRINPDWMEENTADKEDHLFHCAMMVAGKDFEEMLHHYAKSWLPGRSIVADCIKLRNNIDPSGEIMLLKRYCPDDRSLAWRVQAVAVAPGQFDSRKPLPLGWRGLRDDELTEVAGIDGCVFVHSSGFIGGNKTMDGALEMARKSLRIQ